MDGSSHARLGLTAIVMLAFGCSGPATVALQPAPTLGDSGNLDSPGQPGVGQSRAAEAHRFDVLVDPSSHVVDINPVGFSTKTTGIYVESRNANWNAPTFSFDLIVWNNNATMVNDVQGVILSTTPGAPTITMVGQDGATADGKPYYSYGNLDTPSAYVFDPFNPPSPLPWSGPYPPWGGAKNWRFSDPAAVPFRFGFEIRSGSGSVGASKNNPPVIASLSPAANPISVGTTTTVAASVADPNGDSLTYGWKAPSGGTISGAGNSAIFTAPATPGTYPVEVTVNDGKGGVVTRRCDISVVATSGDGVQQGSILFGWPFVGADEPASIDIEFLYLGPVVTSGQQPWINAHAWTADHTREVPTTFTWSQTGSTPDHYMGNLDRVGENTWITWLTRRGFTHSGSPQLTARAANGLTKTFSLTILEEPPAIYNAWPQNDATTGLHATATSQRNQENRYYFKFGDPNGNMHLPPVVTVAPAGTVYTTALEGPDDGNEYRLVVTVPPNGFPTTGVASVGLQVADDTATASHAMTISVQ